MDGWELENYFPLKEKSKEVPDSNPRPSKPCRSNGSQCSKAVLGNTVKEVYWMDGWMEWELKLEWELELYAPEV